MKHIFYSVVFMLAALIAGNASASRNHFKKSIPDSQFRWYDGKDLQLKGKGFVGEPLYGRVPADLVASAADLAPFAVSTKQSSGLNLRFNTNSWLLRIRWTLPKKPPYGWLNVSGSLAAGIDVYAWISGSSWRYWASGLAEERTNTLDVPWIPNRPCTIYLPALGALESIQIGVNTSATIFAARPYAHPKPVVVYGASMVHGFCSSRPGNIWTSVLSRMLDVEVVNHGYSGNGKMEETMLRVLGDIDAAAYCFFNCGQNMSYADMKAKFRPFLEKLHKRRPDAPILLGGYYYVNGPDAYDFRNPKRDFIQELVVELRHSDPKLWSNIHHVRMEDMFVADGDGAVDAAHLNDRGAHQVALAYADILRRALNID